MRGKPTLDTTKVNRPSNPSVWELAPLAMRFGSSCTLKKLGLRIQSRVSFLAPSALQGLARPDNFPQHPGMEPAVPMQAWEISIGS